MSHAWHEQGLSHAVGPIGRFLANLSDPPPVRSSVRPFLRPFIFPSVPLSVRPSVRSTVRPSLPSSASIVCGERFFYLRISPTIRHSITPNQRQRLSPTGSTTAKEQQHLIIPP